MPLFGVNQITEGVTKIGRIAFYGCSSLTEIDLPESVTEIDESAFTYCSSLTSIHLPESLTEIGDQAFYGCSSLTSIRIPKDTKVSQSAFEDCDGKLVIERF